MKRNLLVIQLVLISFFALGQEEVVTYTVYSENSKLKSSSEIVRESKIISLPIFDDFSYPTKVPTTDYWFDSNAFINNSFGKNTPSIGVASLDALNSKGELHSNASQSQFEADNLTSYPINLKTYLDFYPSHKLYINNSGYQLLDDSYFIFKDNEYHKVSEGYDYHSGDTLYTFNGSNYIVLVDSIYYKNGADYFYINGSYEKLTINNNYESNNNIGLSFYFQSGGYGDLPEPEDSLALEFYVASDREGIFINEVTNNWIEIINATDTISNIKDYYLLPAHLDTILKYSDISNYKLDTKIINPYGYSIVYASELSLNSIDSTVLYLLNPNLEVIDSIISNKIVSSEISYSRIPDCSTNWEIASTTSQNYCNPNWEWIWSTNSETGDNFYNAYIAITNSKFLKKGFRFRFKNYASLSNDESHARNEDFWNLDMVWLDKDRTDVNTTPADVVFTDNISPIYSNYYALPMSHFKQTSKNDFFMTINSFHENFSDEVRQVNFFLEVEKTHTNQHITSGNSTNEFLPFQTVEVIENLNTFKTDVYNFIAIDTASQEFGEYIFKYYYSDIDNENYKAFRWNDTSRITFTLDNYYAYDDGTAEAGYGLREAPMGRVAYKFTNLMADTIKAIDIYFNPTLNTSTPLFNLCIWDEGEDGKPGNLLYYMPGEKVKFDNGLYNFVTYKISEDGFVNDEQTEVIVDGNYFIGWQQPYDVLLNVGLDIQSTVKNKLYYNLGFEWTESVQTGVLLMRPVFDKLRGEQTSFKKQQNNIAYIYPSIAINNIFIKNTSSDNILSYSISNNIGQQVYMDTYKNNSISVSNLPNGLYHIQLLFSNGELITQSFLKK